MTKLFDTHAHYDDHKFDTYEKDREELLKDLFENEVEYIMGASINIETSLFQIEYSKKFEGFYASVGIHPENCGEYDDPDKALFQIEKLSEYPKVKAIGEIGLDYYWEENPPKEYQKLFFEKQMEIARRKNLPVIVHDREAHGDVFETILKYPDVIGVLHSYSGSVEMAKELLKRGWYISFSGVITFKNASRIAEVVKSIPDGRILIETDCPYLAPVPERGKINHSGYARYTAEKAAELRNANAGDFIEMTKENGKRLFGI